MSNRRTYHELALDTLERALHASGLARACLMEEAVRLHRLACESDESDPAAAHPADVRCLWEQVVG